MKEMEEIGNIIDSVVSKMGMNSRISNSNIFNHWPEIVGEGIANKSQPRKLVRKILYISVTSSTWANELSLMSEKLIDRINAYAGGTIVTSLRFKADL